MKLINEKIRHISYGDGKITAQEDNILSVKFAGQQEVKKFVYPDAFDKYLKMGNPEIEVLVLEVLHIRQEELKAEELRKQKESDEAELFRKIQRDLLTVKKKKPAAKSKVGL
ncbi:MAG: hypothetical protein HGA22_10870 [Clostridiales bacterium]|nr:hypothetical protein [Clostridiales bacterium]